MTPRRVHLIGIGGAGMAGLAHYLVQQGHEVSGSDTAKSPETIRLEGEGVTVAYGHDATHVDGRELVVVSDAIATNNIELETARARNIAFVGRAECLGRLAAEKRSILVAGSHGKSTTTAMIACVLERAGLEPGYIVGADIPCLGNKRARAGGGAVFVAEACEAFRNLESLRPEIAVLTNIDDEHLNHYASQQALDQAFADFAGRGSHAIVAGDNSGVDRIGASLGSRTTFGLSPDCDLSADASPAAFSIRAGADVLGTIELAVPGDHMRRNALAAVAVCRRFGIAFDVIVAALADFTGVARRWQEVGTSAGVRFIDDYAHHPAEIAATLQTARDVAPRRVIAVFQPLLHSRVERLHAEIAEALSLADSIFLLELDPGGEIGASAGSRTIADDLRRRHRKVFFHDDVDVVGEAAVRDAQQGDIVVVMGGRGVEGLALKLRDQRPRAPSTAYVLHRSRWDRLADRWRAPQTVVDLIRKRARARPRSIAIEHAAARLSYEALDAASDAVAAALASRGMARATIGVALAHGADLVVGALGIMKAGGTYLPIDTNLPIERARYMLATASAKALMTHEPWDGLECLAVGSLTAHGGSAPSPPAALDHAYICFTSGSTGFPKGNAIRHAALFGLLRDSVRRVGLRPGARMAMNTSISFDISLAEIFGTLAAGATLVIGGPRPIVGDRLAGFLADQAISHLSVTPTVLASMQPRPLPKLRCIIACGEAPSPKLVEDWAPGRRFINAYGPTEATIYATMANCVAGRAITIGTALAHVATHVFDEHQRPVARGETGELCLSGIGLSDGYIGQEAQTRERFVETAAGRVYRTGDMVRVGARNALHFVGRVDNQIKVLGTRIELEEIESTALRQPGVADAVACVNTEESAALICFVRPEPGAVLETAMLVEALAAWLPPSFVPSHVVLVDSLPLTPSGKRDRRRLLREHRARVLTWAAHHLPPETENEERLAVLWRNVLKLDRDVGMLDRFASLGGDSMAGLLLVSEIEAAFGVAIPPGYFGRLSTIQRMAVLLEELLWHRTAKTPSDAGFRGTRIYQRMQDLSGHWAGTRTSAERLISTLGGTKPTYDLFLCCQAEEEFLALRRWLPDSFSVHAMRSGHLVIDHGPASLRSLSTHYAEEIAASKPSGILVMAGVCQGGVIAQLVAEALAERGFDTALLVFIEPVRPRRYAGEVAIICGDESFRNPLHAEGIGRQLYDEAFGTAYSIDTVRSVHGQECVEPAVQDTAKHIIRRMATLSRQASGTFEA